MKDEYLSAVRGARFRDVTVGGEDIYPVQPAVNDPVVQAIYSDAGFVSGNAKEISESVAGVKISAVKPG